MRCASLSIARPVVLIACTLLAVMLLARVGLAQEQIPDEILDIFDSRCAFSGCHAGTRAPKGLDLTEEFALASLVNQPSRESKVYLRVQPKNPAGSYLIMKIRGAPGIEGKRMPNGKTPLSGSEIAAIERWIESLPTGMKVQAPERKYAEAFPGLTLATLPTAETLESGFFSYRIAHRWRGEVVDSGFAELFGLDAGARILTQLTFALSNEVDFSVGRTSANATFEFIGKWRFLRERNDGAVPLSAAVVAGLDWATRKHLTNVAEDLSRTNSERFHWFAQVALSKRLGKRVSVLFAPGVLLNGNAQVDDEEALVTLGFGAKLMLIPDLSIFVEGVPIISGSESADIVEGARNESGELVFNDTFTVGLEKKVGGHVFHVYITNSIGLSTNQYLSGGNLDFSEGKFRLGFNVYRTLRLPF
ncbi:MAG: DUF5777 family beta-barrel protein [bacterium]